MSEQHKYTSCLTMVEIKSYLTDQSDKKEKHRVEAHLIDCPMCTDAIEGYATQTDIGKEIKLSDLNHQKSDTSKTKYFYMNKIVASILLLLIPIATYLYLDATGEEPLYNEYFQPIKSEAFAQTRSANGDQALHPEFEKGLDFYNQKNFSGSIRHLENYIAINKEDASASFYLGVSALENDQLAKANKHLKIARINDEKYYEEATWYLILTKLKEGEKEEAKQLIEEILKIKNGFYHEKATSLKNSLD